MAAAPVGTSFFAEPFGGAGSFTPIDFLPAPLPPPVTRPLPDSFIGPMDPLAGIPLPVQPGIPAGGLSFGTPQPGPSPTGIPLPTPFSSPFTQGPVTDAGCNLLPAGALRDACLAAAGLFFGPGGGAGHAAASYWPCRSHCPNHRGATRALPRDALRGGRYHAGADSRFQVQMPQVR